MAFEPKKVDFSTINGGREYDNGDIVSPKDFNDVFKSSHYTQKFVEIFGTIIDISEIGGTGEPSAGFIDTIIDGQTYKVLKLYNLKGQRGASGVNSAYLMGEDSNTGSETNGLTQKAINSLINNPNILINPDFKINQRNIKSYISVGETQPETYLCDRWKLVTDGSGVAFTQNEDNSVTIQNNTDKIAYLRQEILGEIADNLKGSYVSVSFTVNGGYYSATQKCPLELINSTGIAGIYSTMPSGFAGALYYDNTTGNFAFDIEVYPTYTVTIKNAKMEIGRFATPILTPNYADELIKCQHYYQELQVSETVLVLSTSPTIYIPTIVTMRDSYTLAVTTARLSSINRNIDVVLSPLRKHYNAISVKLSTSDGTTIPKDTYLLSAGTIKVEAEL